MSRSRAIAGTIVFFFLAPGTVAGLIPWWITGWRDAGTLGQPALWLGIVLIAAGLAVLIDCFARFALKGIGTPAPVAPTEKLVISGTYRFVRNPMYLAVLAIIAGQALIFGSWWLIAYGATAWLVTHVFVIAYEEPALRRQFPADYAAYAGAVGRWLPRPRPWRGEDGG